MAESALQLFNNNDNNNNFEEEEVVLVEDVGKKRYLEALPSPSAEKKAKKEKEEEVSSSSSPVNIANSYQCNGQQLLAWKVDTKATTTVFQTDRNKSQMWMLFKAAKQLNDVKMAKLIDGWLGELHGAFDCPSFLYEPSAKVKVAIHLQTTSSMTLLAGHSFVEAILERMAESNDVGRFDFASPKAILQNSSPVQWELKESSQMVIIPPTITGGDAGDGSGGPMMTVQIDTRLGTFTCLKRHYHVLEELVTQVLQRCSSTASVLTLYRNMLPASWKGLLTTDGGGISHTLGGFGLVEQYGAMVSAGEVYSGQCFEISQIALICSGQPLEVVIQKIRQLLGPSKLIKVEVSSLEAAFTAANAGADILLFKLGHENALSLAQLLAILEHAPQVKAAATYQNTFFISSPSSSSGSPTTSKRVRRLSPLLVEVHLAESVVSSEELLALALPQVDIITLQPSTLQLQQMPELHFYLRII